MTHAGEYVLTDNAYAHLLDQLAKHNFEQVTPELRENILAFYRDPSAPIATKRNPQGWQKTQDEIERLKAFVPSETPASPTFRRQFKSFSWESSTQSSPCTIVFPPQPSQVRQQLNESSGVKFMRRDAHLKGGLFSWQMIWIKTDSKAISLDSRRTVRSVRPKERPNRPEPVSRTQQNQQNQQKKGGQGQNEEDENQGQGQRRAS